MEIHAKYLNKRFIQNIILLGDFFGVPIQNITFEKDLLQERVNFFDGCEEKGYVEYVEINTKEKEKGCYFVLHSKIGELTGEGTSMEFARLNYSLSVEGKPYDAVTGSYHASENRDGDGNWRQEISLFCEKGGAPFYHIGFDLRLLSEFIFSKEYQDKSGRNLQDEFEIFPEKPYAYKFRNRAKVGQNYKTQFQIESSLEDEFSRQLGVGFYNSAEIEYQKYRDNLLKQMHTDLTFDGLDLYQNFITASYESTLPFEKRLLADDVERMTGVRPKEYQKNRDFVKQLQKSLHL